MSAISWAVAAARRCAAVGRRARVVRFAAGRVDEALFVAGLEAVCAEAVGTPAKLTRPASARWPIQKNGFLLTRVVPKL